ncbi:olfactory receptor 7A10-like [Ochotona princeps]|uniref:olfactory receptor 7A10-like n=1 Tax=Ochotona princeps TaxID=9978 RepID=UPI002714690A|nr:olfactory receptor 7A10-like [Ochotona princeps]
MYLVTVRGDLLIVLAILSDPHLHTPMYFFLTNLSLVDACFTSTNIPEMLVNIQIHTRAISCAGCITQMFFFLLCGGLDGILLTMMSYDRFVAICHPLYYPVIITPLLCVQLVLVCWVISVLNAMLHILKMLSLNLCTHVDIPHFFCELNQVVQLSCSDRFLNDLMIYIVSVLLGGGSLAGILYSDSIIAISSAQGKYKAFSTCASHFSAISLFYATSIGVFLSASAAAQSVSTAVASVLYTVVTPMLNVFIYNLRNADMKKALTRLLAHKPH